MANQADTPGADTGFDSVLNRLRSVVGKLEQGNLSLEDSLAAYEQGVELARQGHQILDRAEKRVELLVAGGQRVPFDIPTGDGDGDAANETGDSE